jgi:serine/threonine protein phosphatase 1
MQALPGSSGTAPAAAPGMRRAIGCDMDALMPHAARADPMSPLTFAIGDIHGCLKKLLRLVKACEAHAAGRRARYVFLGDYIDRGPHSCGVIEFLIRRQQAQPDSVVCLMGNHEQLALMAHESDRAMPLWLANSGAATQRSYWRTGGRIAEPHLSWLRALPLCHDDGLRLFVHAGIDLAVPLDRQSADTLLWMREPFLTDCDTVDCGRFIVHGHTPLAGGKPDLCRRRVNLDTGAVIGGPLTAAVFDDTRAEPLGFLTDARAG